MSPQRSWTKIVGAVEKTRTSTGCPTATSTLRVYQFRHDRTSRKKPVGTGPRHVANRFRRNKRCLAAGRGRTRAGFAMVEAVALDGDRLPIHMYRSDRK